MRELVGSVFPRESCVGSASLSVKLPMLVAPNLLEEMFIRIELARAEANSIANILPMGDGLVWPLRLLRERAKMRLWHGQLPPGEAVVMTLDALVAMRIAQLSIGGSNEICVA